LATLADYLKPSIESIRGIPGSLGLRPHTVTLLARSWSGDYTGDGDRTDVDTEINEGGYPPKVRWLSDDEIAVGSLESGVVEIGPITPDHVTRSILGDIRGDELDAGDGRFLIITGPKSESGSKYRLIRITADRAFRYMLRARPVD
jgi:hypothetical protein